MSASAELTALIEGFFLRWAERDRKLSEHTVSSYRDAFRLYFTWLRDVQGVDAVDATMDDVTAENVNAFLNWLESERGNCPKTLNCRLAAFWSFARYAAREAPQHIGKLSAISDIPKRKARRKEIDYLTPEEVDWVLDGCEPGSESELMIMILYNTGARISELLNATAGDVRVSSTGKCHIHFLGKGRKDRTVPLWEDTSELLVAHIKQLGLEPGDYLFAGRNVDHLTRSGARSRIEAAVKRARALHPELERKRVTAHVFRHSTAMALLAAGVDIGTVAALLGHEDINTTHKYVVTDMAAKEAALEKARHKWDVRPREQYKASGDVLAFLNSL